MPNFLKSLFKKPQKRSKRDAQLQTRPTELESPDPSPSPSPQIGLPKKDIEILADLLHRELQAGNGRDPQDLLYVLAQPDVDTQATLRRLLEVLQDTRSRDEEEVGTPLPLGPELGRSAMEDAASRWRKGTRGKGVRRIEVGSGGGDVHSELARVIEACVAAISVSTSTLPAIMTPCSPGPASSRIGNRQKGTERRAFSEADQLARSAAGKAVRSAGVW